MIDLFGHLFYFFILCGLVLLAKGNALGWALRLVGETGWAVLGIFLGLSSVYVWGFAFVIIDAYGFYYWSKR